MSTDDPEEADRHAAAPHPRETAVLFGQSDAEATYLEAARSGRLHHAWLLTGPRGVGKATLAWRIARHLIAGGTGESLEMAPEHPVFRQLATLASPQLFLGRRPWDDKAERLKTAITIDEIRGLKSFFQLSATEGGRRMAIIDAADDLNGPAANALLKILEEPPARAVLLLVCHRPDALLPTIRSRCRLLRLAPLGASDLGAALAAAGAAEATEPGLATLAGGSVGAALDLAEAGGLAIYNDILTLLRVTPLDRRRINDLAAAAAGRAAAERYGLILDLTALSLGRMARAAAGLPLVPVSDAEAEVIARLAQRPEQALIWARLSPELTRRTSHARAVNLDPAQVILDTFLKIDAAAAEARALAA